MCNYCNGAVSTHDHLKWECSFFAPTRIEIDEELATIPHKCIPACIKNGIAPAMKIDGKKTFWGAAFDEQLDEKARTLLGENRELHTPGSDAKKTDERQAALDIIEGHEVRAYNARQVMLKHKAAHGSGSNLTFPDANEIEANMKDYPTSFTMDIYGDGSYISPTIWWAALGGFGVWMSEWISPNEAEARQQPLVQPTGTLQPYEANTTKVSSCLANTMLPVSALSGTLVTLSIGTANRWSPSNSVPSDATSQLDHSSQGPSPEQQQGLDQRQQLAMPRQDTTLHGAAISQTGTSTRQELTAWINQGPSHTMQKLLCNRQC